MASLALIAGVATAAADEGRSTGWSTLTAAQRTALAPLQRDWESIDLPRRQKWLQLAARFPQMPAAERQRVQARMSEWSSLTPNERSRARQQFQDSRQLGADVRQERWLAYRALPDEERRELAQRSRPAGKTPPDAKSAAATPPGAATGKRNLVDAPRATANRAGTSAVVQARPGATTTLLSKQTVPPAHHQPGLPKIAATPGFVDQATLLPQRGPQGAAVRSAASADPGRRP